MTNKIVIIGCGNVGMSYAYALVNQKTKVNEIVLIDLDPQRINGEAMDLNHGLPFAPSKIKIKAGTYDDCKGAAIICICAGANQEKGETRLDLLSKNNKIFKSIIDKIMPTGFNGIFLVATNPVDIMTYFTYKHSKFPTGKVIGSGTSLDTARLRYLIGEKLNVNSKNVHAYVMGEHGDSEFVLWSNAYVGSVSIQKFLNQDQLEKIGSQVKNAAYEIINGKGATYYAIGLVLVRITNAILDDENTILTVSSYDKEHDIYIGMPSIVGKNGVTDYIEVSFTEEEKEKFISSANIIKKEVDKL